MKEATLKNSACPCGSGLLYPQCCEPFILGSQLPQIPEQLMRSRYTAYALHNIDYIFNTMKDKALKRAKRKKVEQSNKTIQWLGLNVLSSSPVEEDSDTGTVEFMAYYTDNRLNKNQKKVLHENSQFKKFNNQWYYVDALKITSPSPQTHPDSFNRNAPCPCGSQKKYKHCCERAR